MPNAYHSVDSTLAYDQLDRKHTVADLRRCLMGEGATLADLRGCTRKEDYIRLYMSKLGAAAPATPRGNVTVIRRVQLVGKGCDERNEHTIALDSEDGENIVVYQDACDIEYGGQFHTTLSDLKAAVAALEAV